MDDHRLGCLAPSSMIAGFLTILIIVGMGLARGGALFSPGPLNAKTGQPLGGVTSHAALSGKCFACHGGLFQQVTMADRCVVCHTDISAQRLDPSTLHGNLEKNGSGLLCRECHLEHGRPLTDLAKANVVHSNFGYALTAHKTNTDGSVFGCTDCHKQDFVRFDITVCASCHQQVKADFIQDHLQAYGENCLSCHDGKDTYGHKFDHSGVPFELSGKHAQVACGECHLNPRSLADFKTVPVDCSSCHIKDNPHSELLGTACASCHTAEGWQQATFDHDLAAFKLEDKHAQVACTDCHVDNLYKGTPTDCYSCHKRDDTHNGQFGTNCSLCHSASGWKLANYDHNRFTFKLTGKHINAACISCHVNSVFKGTASDCASCHVKSNPHSPRLGTTCSSCHTTAGWSPATFDHNLAAFPLTGQHGQVACTNCHVNNIYRGTATDCNSCHRNDDKHNGQYGGNCSTCHSTSAWRPANFNHNLFSFQLTGKHSGVACSNCHANGIFQGTPSNCASCHGQSNPHSALLGTNCASCHTTSGWQPATFDHNMASFKLTGQHAQVSCTSCHANHVYNGTPSACNSCHAQNDAHSGQFGTNCASCHTTSAWRPATFDHNLSSFKLTGAHSQVSCNSCHANNVYKGTPTSCNSCHAQNDAHSGQFGTNCASCHTTSAWRPATFDHNLSSFKLTGAHSQVSCASCHVNNVYKGTPTSCYSCHANDDKHGGQYGTNCASCHTTAGWSQTSFSHSGFPLTQGHSGLSCNSCHASGQYAGLSTACSSCHSDPAYHSGLFSSDCAQCHNTSNWNASYSGSHPSSCDGSCINHRGATCRDCHTTSLSSATCTKCHDSNKPGD